MRGINYNMRIMHYFLGFPPYRTGGLTKYAMDIMNGQIKDGHKVMAIWPGKIELLSNRTRIKKRKVRYGIENYEIINPLPVSLDEGISDIRLFMKSGDIKVFYSFLEKVKPDVVHIHTLMGLHSEFVKAMNLLEIKSIFTTHDYFGICPKVNLYRNGKACENDHNCMDCVSCNQNALSFWKIYLLQSHFYQMIKNCKLISQLRKIHRNNFFVEEKLVTENNCVNIRKAGMYIKLREFYIKILEDITIIHFNSSVAENVYSRFFLPKRYKIISITHKDIADNRKKLNKSVCKKIRYTYLGSAKPAKGFDIIRQAFDELWESGKHDICLNIFFEVSNSAEYMNVQGGGFNYSQLEEIFDNTDILLAPSVWYETFGFTVLEALSYGVPVIISENVGAKDIVNGGGIIIKAGSVRDLKEVIESINIQNIDNMCSNILNGSQIKLNRTLLNEMYEMYLS